MDPLQQATIFVDTSTPVGTIDPMIFGQYLEHVQPEDACIYGAIVDEPSQRTDEQGFRTDVIEAVRALRVPIVRWPGGCFADIYHWQDGIGPRDQRPVRQNWHWGGLESNAFGTDEFLQWCERTGTAPYLNVNLGTGTLNEAIRWLDYCNGTELTNDVRSRHENGHVDPYNVRYWGIGNEQWGAWEAGHMGASAYAAKLHNWAQFLRKLDPHARFLGIGSEAAGDPAWDMEVISAAGHLIDYLTLHLYGHALNHLDDYYAVVSLPIYFDERIRTMSSVIDMACQKIGRETPIPISIDEWNIRHMFDTEGDGHPTLRRNSPRTLRDAIAAAGVLHTMIRHSNAVQMANYVFLLNGNGVLLVDDRGVVKTPLFHLFEMYRNRLLPNILDTMVTSGERITSVRMKNPQETELRTMAYIDAIASRGNDDRALTVAVINRHLDEDIAVRIEPSDEMSGRRVAIETLMHEDPLASNTRENPDDFGLTRQSTHWEGVYVAPAHSVSLLTFS